MKDRNDRINQPLIKSGDLVVDVFSFQNGFQKEVRRYRQEIWDYVRYRESLVKWPAANEKIASEISSNYTMTDLSRGEG